VKSKQTMGLAGVLALALMATFGAAEAAARAVYQADQTTLAPNRTSFSVSGPVSLANSLISNDCTGTMGGKITDNGSTGNTIFGDLATVSFTSCDFTTTANNPGAWTLTMPQTGNPGNVGNVDASIVVFGTTCKFKTDATHTVNGNWSNGSPSSVTLSGSVVLYSGAAWVCGSTGSVSGTLSITSTSTPGNNLYILPAP
jgi:hypothetical protein